METIVKKGIRTPIYQQIVNHFVRGIEKGDISKNDKAPSISQVAAQNQVAKETVVKAFKILQERGIINSVHGKGFFVATSHIETQHRVFLLLDALTPYKQRLYESIKDTFGSLAFIDVYFHHYNIDVFSKLTEEAKGNYSAYIVIPFQDKKIPGVINGLPTDKVLILDQKPRALKDNYHGVYQDFHNDVYSALSQLKDQISRYDKLTLVFRNTATKVPGEVREGFVAYCSSFGVNAEVVSSIDKHQVQKGESFLIIDDEDLVYVIEQCISNNLKIGEDIGILSYNDTPLKRVVSGGITVISTDFEVMGKVVAQMIQNSERSLVANPSQVINRNSF